MYAHLVHEYNNQQGRFVCASRAGCIGCRTVDQSWARPLQNDGEGMEKRIHSYITVNLLLLLLLLI